MRSEQLGRYKILAELARGASGVVYKARDPLIDRIVSIKTVDIDLPADDVQSFQKRLEREVRAAGRLNHPNIATLYDVGSSGNVAYIAMEFMDGRSLRDVLDSRAVVLPARIADIAAQVATGLQFAHEHGIVHRDVKPDSIVVLRSGLVKLTNFGIAKVSSGSRTRIDVPNAGPIYMSPEQLMGRPADERSDIFSLGAVLYEMLMGLPPFAAGNLSEIIHRIVQQPLAPPSSSNRAVSAAFDAIVAKAMAKNPGDRYRSARELAFDLRKLAGPSSSDAPASETVVAATSGERLCDDIACDAPVETVTTGETAAPLHSEESFAPRRSRRKWVYSGLVVCLLSTVVAWTLWPQVPGAMAPADEPITSFNASDSFAHAADGASGGDASHGPRLERSEVASEVAKSASQSAPSAERIVAPSRASGRLVIVVSPWGEVFVDGKSKGTSPPLREVELAAGTHIVEFRNSALPAHRQVVTLEPNGRLQIRYKFGE